MIPNQEIFCNAPWYELQIYWDGGLGFCCQASHLVYPESQASHYNVKNMTIKDWFNSDPMKKARLSMFNQKKNSFCNRCYVEEGFSQTSRRHRSNQKSVIFTRTSFAQSYLQSPGYRKFEHARANNGDYDGMPIDLHIDLGNYCNLACKMCRPQASSVIAAQYVKWKISGAEQYVGTDWTRDEAVWNRVLDELAGISNLSNIHFMGGETLITKRFEDFVDYMIERGRTDLNFSFVTNGTTFNESLMHKLTKFKRVGIEVSIETMDQCNAYQRQGTDQALVESNMNRYLSYCNGDSITVTARPAISALTVRSYPTLLRWCLQNKIIVKSLLVNRPAYLDVRVLPDEIRQSYLYGYQSLVEEFDLDQDDISQVYNESDPNQVRKIIKNQINQCCAILSAPRLDHSDRLLGEMVSWCQRWDQIYKFDARVLYPELQNIFDAHGYSV